MSRLQTRFFWSSPSSPAGPTESSAYSSTQARRARNELIDSIRGVAILVVMIHHFHLAYDLLQGFFSNYLPHWFLMPFVANGNYGVILFFVVSGFLITSTTLGRFGDLKNIELLAFYRLRAARILPCLFLMLGIVVVFAILGVSDFPNYKPEPPFWLTVVSVLTFTHNLLLERFGFFNYCLNILWSLSIEEVFYLFFPVLCLFIRRRVWILMVCIGLLLLSPYYRSLHNPGYFDIYSMCDYLACCDGLAMGCIVALIKRGAVIRNPIKSLWVIPVFTLFFTYFYKIIWANIVYGVSTMVIATGTLIFISDNDQKMPKILKSLMWMGRYCYELYLFHIIVLVLMRKILPWHRISYVQKPIWLGMFVFFSCLVSYCVARYFSDPMNRKVRALLKGYP